VILIRNGFEKYYADVYNPVAVVMIHLYDEKKQDIIKYLKKRNIMVFLMPTEGIPTLKSIRKLAAGYFSDLSNIDMHFLWNEEMKKIMLENDIINDSSRLNVVGIPRFDFYREPLNKILIPREKFKKKYNITNNYPIITWTTNFTHASFYHKNQDFLKADWKKLQMDKIFNPEEIARKDFESRKIAFEAIEKMLTGIPEVNLVIKLHPSEDHTYYYKRVNNLSDSLRNRIRIINKAYIWDVLNSTDILLKRSCTTGVEAWLLDKPTIELRLNPEEWYYSKEHAQGSDEVSNYQQLKEAVMYYLQGGSVSSDKKDRRRAFVRKWCSIVDGKATERFVKELDKGIKSRKNNQVKSKKKDFEFIKSFLIANLMELTNFKVHDLKVYGISKNRDKLGRFDKFFNRKDEKEWQDNLLSKIGIYL
jgi:surface carbohydrate biosynthesis protein